MGETEKPAGGAGRRPWTKRHEAAIAVIGALLATTTYFGKDHAQEHWKGLASGIKASLADYDAVDNATSLDSRIDLLLEEVQTLSKDALSIEHNEKPHAQSDRLDSTRGASLSSRNDAVGATLRKCGRRLASLAALDEATHAAVSHAAELKQMRDDVATKLAASNKAAISLMVQNESIFGSAPSPNGSSRQMAENARMDMLEHQTDTLEDKTEELATVIREAAEKQRERYTRYEERTTLLLSMIFVLGLVLSLLGKLSGGEAQASAGE